jgi:hypothetical protein
MLIAKNFINLFIKYEIYIHSIFLVIVFDIYIHFHSLFWKTFIAVFGMKVYFSTAFDFQKYSRVEKANDTFQIFL